MPGRIIEKLRRKNRQVLIHAHLFKNAGSTFDWSLRRSFGDGFTDHREDDDMKRGAGYLGPWLLSNRECAALSSHWITPPLPELSGIDISVCLFLRDPIERMRSVYRFERAQTGVDTPGSVRAKKLGFRDYIEWQFELMPGPVVKNYQTRYLSGNYHGEDLDACFASASAFLGQLPVLGLVHRYDESVVLMEYLLQSRFPRLDLSYIPQNVLSESGGPMEDRRARVLDELGDLASMALEMNRYDIQLFELATRRFDQLLQQLPDRASRLAGLRRRCQALVNNGSVDERG